jgi:alkylhydroperoxidase/carboxymuconolactone decarboxylase family protein YurZ
MSEQVNTYGYNWTDWIAKEDPEYIKVRQPFSNFSAGEGRELSIKYREMVMIGILAFRSRQEAVVAHMRRAIEHGATKRELLEALYAAQVPGGGPTLCVGVLGLMQLEQEGGFKNG